MQFAFSQADGSPLYPVSGGQQASRHHSQQGRILAIEPDEKTRAALDGLLTIHGCDVRTVTSYHAGLDLLSAWEPGLIFLAIDTLDVDVADAITTLQKGRSASAPVVILTGRVFGAQDALRLGAVARVQTPFDVQDILRLVARYAPCS